MILSRITKAVREQNWFAVGIEFIIVILGVVIGFQINALNEARVERNAERDVLMAFSVELDAIHEEVVRARSLARSKLNAAEQLLDPDAGDLSQAELDALLSDLLWHQTGTLDTGLIESLLGSRALTLAQAPELRADLARWPDRISKFLNDQAADALMYDERYTPYLLTHGEVERVGAALRSVQGSINVPDRYVAHLDEVQEARIDHNGLLTDPEFRGIVTMSSWDQVDIMNEADRLERAIEDTQARIRAHLEGAP